METRDVTRAANEVGIEFVRAYRRNRKDGSIRIKLYCAKTKADTTPATLKQALDVLGYRDFAVDWHIFNPTGQLSIVVEKFAP